RLRSQLMEQTNALPRQQVTTLLRRLIDVPASHDPDTLLELILIENLPEEKSTVAPRPEPAPAKEADKKTQSKAAKTEKPVQTEYAKIESFTVEPTPRQCF